jgi:hypothetical protein
MLTVDAGENQFLGGCAARSIEEFPLRIETLELTETPSHSATNSENISTMCSAGPHAIEE